MENRKTLVEDDFVVPFELLTDQFRLRMLSIHDLIKDYDAVMSSVDHLRNTYSLISGSSWPVGLTLEEDLIDLGWHQREFTLRYSFAYTVMTLDETQCLGCVYLEPSRKSSFDVVVSMWVRVSELGNGLDSDLYGPLESGSASFGPLPGPPIPVGKSQPSNGKRFQMTFSKSTPIAEYRKPRLCGAFISCLNLYIVQTAFPSLTSGGLVINSAISPKIA